MHIYISDKYNIYLHTEREEEKESEQEFIKINSIYWASKYPVMEITFNITSRSTETSLTRIIHWIKTLLIQVNWKWDIQSWKLILKTDAVSCSFCPSGTILWVRISSLRDQHTNIHRLLFSSDWDMTHHSEKLLYVMLYRETLK